MPRSRQLPAAPAGSARGTGRRPACAASVDLRQLRRARPAASCRAAGSSRAAAPSAPATRISKNSSRLLPTMHRKRSRSSSGTSGILRQREHAPVEVEQRQLAVDQRIGSDRRAWTGAPRRAVSAAAQPGVAGTNVSLRSRYSIDCRQLGDDDPRDSVADAAHRGLARLRSQREPHAAALRLPVERLEIGAVRRELVVGRQHHDQRAAACRHAQSSVTGASGHRRPAARCRSSATPGRASSRDRPRPGARASSSAPCSVRCALSTPKRSHSASRLLRLPGNCSRASASVSITPAYSVAARAACSHRASS